MGWVWLDHPDLPGGPERFPDDPDVVKVQEARGWKKADAPGEGTIKPVESDEVDDRGQGWVHLVYPETGGTARVPVEVVADEQAKGWRTVAELKAAEEKAAKAAVSKAAHKADKTAEAAADSAARPGRNE